MTAKLRVALLCLGIAPAAVVPRAAAQAQIVVVVRPDAPIDGLSLEELRRLYLGKATRVHGGPTIALLELPEARKLFCQLALGRTEDQVKRNWFAVVFAGEPAKPPKPVTDAEELREFVAAHADAIGYMPLKEVDPRVKVLPIDGLRPGQSGYPLQ